MNVVEEDIKLAFHEELPNACLELYGSCKNGFQVWPWDLDLSLSFNGIDEIAADRYLRNCSVPVLTNVQLLLLQSGRFDRVSTVSCRVPVVKFTHRETGLNGDISLYNKLALRNTKLLRAYSELDERCRMLGLMIKHVFKQEGICDASQGYLPSYAYILMVIFYLQHCEPPVLPCLQELKTADKVPTYMPCGRWNTWFFEDSPEATRSAWSGFGLNKESIGGLLQGFFMFYTELFDVLNQVVSIRQLEPIWKLEKRIVHIRPVLTIEDPFELDHIFGVGREPEKYARIEGVFLKCREHFGTTINSLSARFQTWQAAGNGMAPQALVNLPLPQQWVPQTQMVPTQWSFASLQGGAANTSAFQSQPLFPYAYQAPCTSLQQISEQPWQQGALLEYPILYPPSAGMSQIPPADQHAFSVQRQTHANSSAHLLDQHQMVLPQWPLQMGAANTSAFQFQPFFYYANP